MKAFGLFLAVLFSCLLIAPLIEAGTYYIGKDDGGAYFQTDQDDGWYIDEEDLRYFKVGDTGVYSIGKDRNGTYLITDKKRKFYIDTSARDKLTQEIDAYNIRQQTHNVQWETKVIIKGNRVMVPVVLGYKGRQMELLLLLDTGASITTLHRISADKLKIGNTQKATIMVVGGSTINADVAKLDYMKVGPNLKENIYATIIDHKGERVAHQGLLGMNFLRGLEYKIDFKRQVINWK